MYIRKQSLTERVSALTRDRRRQQLTDYKVLGQDFTKRKRKKSNTNEKMGMKNRKPQSDKEEKEPPTAAAVIGAAAKKNDDDDSDSSASSEEDADDLVLEGVLVRNPDASSSDDSSDSDNSDEEEDSKPPPSKKSKGNPKKDDSKQSKQQQASNQKKRKKKKKKKKDGEDQNIETIPVDFEFCDMNEKYFHGLKMMLTSVSPVYAAHSSDLADTMIENVSVGKVCSCDMGGDPDTVFGFVSVLSINTNNDHLSIQALSKLCLDKCPSQHKKELEIVLSGKTKRPAGFYLHGRMMNLPLEIVEVLHQQVVLDMDWAVDNAEGGEEERKSLNFGAFVRIAPSFRSGNQAIYKYFDDEVFADHAEFKYEISMPKTYGMEETPHCMVIVMTKTGHRDAMKAMSKLVNT